MEQFKPGIYIARDPKKVKYGGEDEGSWLSKYSFVEPEDFEKVASKLKSGKTGDRPIYTRLKTYHKDIWNSIQKNFGIKEEEFSLSDIIEIQEEVVIEQDGKKIILEKGDRIEVLEDKFMKIIESQQILAPYDIKVDYIQDDSDRNNSLLPVGSQKGGLGRISSKNQIIEKGSPCEIVVMSTAGQGSIAFLVVSDDFDLGIQKFVWLAYGSKKEAREDGWNI